MTDASDTVASDDGGAPRAEAYCPECGQSFPPDHTHCPHDRARLVQLANQVDPLLGRVFEKRYEIRSRLGEGGMGAVYRSWQLAVDREVAIKVIDPRLSGNRIVVKRFLREARLSSRLSQPSIVNVYDFGQTEDGILYIVMELLRGHTLGAELQAHGALGIPRTLHIGVQLCDALEAAHKQGIVHRDLKPGNVMILHDPPGRDLVKVLDFGLAKSLAVDAASKVTHSDAMLGTPLYMSPEQIAGQPSDQRADLYSLGCMLHEMLSGTSPFGGTTIDRVLSNHLYELAAPLPPDVPPPIAGLILRMIAKQPADRPQTAADVRRALLAELGHPTFGARDMTPPPSHMMSQVVSQVARPIAVSSTVQAIPLSPSTSPSVTGEPRRPRWGLRLVMLLALAAVATAMVISLSRDRGPRSAAPGPVPASRDAAAPPAPDAAIDAAPALDATTPPAVDAGPPAAPIDAGRPSRPPRKQPPAVPTARPAPDAGSELDFYKPPRP